MPDAEYPCAQCGKTLTRRPTRGRPPKFCSSECRATHWNAARRQSTEQATCCNPTCGAHFPRTHPKQLYCSDRCARRCAKRRYKKKLSDRRRHGYVGALELRDPVLVLRVHDSDLGRYYRTLRADPCAYCGGQHEEIEHITPRSKGGANAWDNYTSSCARCNAAKFTYPLIRFLLRERLKEGIADVQQQIELIGGA